MCFNATPKPAPSPVIPATENTEVQTAIADEKKKAERRRGRQATILSGASGLDTETNTGGRTTLGGR